MSTLHKSLLVWEASIFRASLDCKGCHTAIAPKSVFFIDPYDIKYLVPNGSGYEANSVRCAGCGLLEFLSSEFGNLATSAMNNYDPLKQSYQPPILTAIRQIVRQELQQILKEEAFDPHGPFSPAP